MNGARKSSRAKVISCMAEHGEATMYEVKQDLGISYSVVHDVVKKLCRKCFLRWVRREPSKRGGEKQVYRVTLAGVLLALSFLDDRDHRDRVIERNRELIPLVLGKMEVFKRHGVAAIVLERLKCEAGFSCGGIAAEISRRGEAAERQLAREFTADFYQSMIVNTKPEDVRRVFKAADGDRELRRFLGKMADKVYRDISPTVKLAGELREQRPTARG